MAYVSMSFYSEGTQINVNPDNPQQTQTIVVNPSLIFTPEYVPGQFTFAFTLGLMGIDVKAPQQLRLIFRDPSNKAVIDTAQDVRVPENSNLNDLPEDMQGIIINAELKNVVIALNGEYKIEAYLAGEKLGEFPIKIKGKNG